jgi:small subunit ribosomal protein S2
MIKLPTVLELLQAGVHFGHKESRWHPKMQEYIYGTRNGIHIIDLEKTLVKLEQALHYVTELVARGGIILFLGTKRQAAGIVQKYALECGMPYVTGRWLGGTLTNYGEVMNLVRHYNDLKTKQANGDLAKYTKKEQAMFAKEIEDLENKVGGIKNVVRPPDALFVIDLMKEKTAVLEAVVRKIPIIALTDTNVNPELAAYAIPSNDDAVKTIELMTKLVSEAVLAGKELRLQKMAENSSMPSQTPKEKAIAVATDAPVGK